MTMTMTMTTSYGMYDVVMVLEGRNGPRDHDDDDDDALTGNPRPLDYESDVLPLHHYPVKLTVKPGFHYPS